MAHFTRSAARQARELIEKGFKLSEYEKDETGILTPEEEDDIDAGLMGLDDNAGGIPEEDLGSQPEEDPHDTSRFPSYGTPDIDISVKDFKPARPPGPHLGEMLTRMGTASFTRAVDFFQLFFTEEIILMLCQNTNLYGWLNILEKPTYSKYNDAAWEEVQPEEMKRFLALIIMMGFIILPDISRYWSLSSLYAGGWARRFMSRNRFKALLGMVHVTNPNEEDKTDKVAKIRPLLEHMKTACYNLYQPQRNVCIDERMVKSKGRSGIRQFMPNKPVRFGYKCWCICESHTGYTLDFDIYTGRRERPSCNGLAYDVVMKLMSKFKNQGYMVYMDNFYTSVNLAKELLEQGTHTCGTTLPRRRGFPQTLKDKAWCQKARRGAMRYHRDGDIMCLQWQDNKPVCVCSSMHRGHEFVLVRRRMKGPDGQFRLAVVRKPKAIHDYNQHMGGVDLADQMLQTYNVLLRSARWWKTIFFHIIDVAVLNAFIMFKEWQRRHPEIPELKRPPGYSHLHFREELVRELANIDEHEAQPSEPLNILRTQPNAIYHTAHVPEYTEARKNCRVCYLQHGLEVKTNWKCAAEQCGIHVCLNKTRNCMSVWHSPAFDQHRQGVYKHTHTSKA